MSALSDQAPRPSRPRATRLRRLVAAALAVPLALAGLITTSAPALAQPVTYPIMSPGTPSVEAGVPFDVTFTCENVPDVTNGVVWHTSAGPSGSLTSGTVTGSTTTYSTQLTFGAPGQWSVTVDCVAYPDSIPFTYSSGNFMVNVLAPAVASTTTVVAVQNSTVEPHNPIQASATVTSGGVPVTSGLVQFMVDGAPVGVPVPLTSSGVAQAQISGQLWGSRVVTASYSGTEAFNASTSQPVSVWVKATPTVTLETPESVVVGSPVSLRATVSGVGDMAAPTGQVQFRHGESILGTAVIVDGVAVLELSGLAVGAYTGVIAVYSGDTTYAGTSGGNNAFLVIAPPVIPPVIPPVTPPVTPPPVLPPPVLPAAAPRFPQVKIPVIVTTAIGTRATIPVGLPETYRPTGSVSVSEGGSALLNLAIPTSGDLTLRLPVLSPGMHYVVVRTPASETVTATERVVVVTVIGAPPKGSLTPDADLAGSTSTIQSGGEITLVARDFIPGETVAFHLYSDPVFLGTAIADASGVATLVVALPAGTPAGAHHVQAIGGTSQRWAEIPLAVTAAAPAAALAETGAPVGSMLTLALVLAASGALLLGGRRRMAVAAG